MPTTLKKFIEEHPEWANLDVGILTATGEVDYIDDSGLAFTTIDEGKEILVFAPN